MVVISVVEDGSVEVDGIGLVVVVAVSSVR